MTTSATCVFSVASRLLAHSTGKERDTESGNDYFKYRYYASSMGRWMSPDPSGLSHVNLADPQQLNLYNYVGNNPLTRRDLDGLCWKGFQWACDLGHAIDNGVHNLGQAISNAHDGLGFHTDKTVIRNLHNANQTLRQQGISTEGWKEKDILKAAKQPHEPNQVVTDATDTVGLFALGAGKAGKYGLGPVSSVVSLWNDPSPKNFVMTGVPFLVEDSDVPLAVVGVAQDGSEFVGNQVITPVFTPDVSQFGTTTDGNGHDVYVPDISDAEALTKLGAVVTAGSSFVSDRATHLFAG